MTTTQEQRAFREHGFTNDAVHIDAVRAWVAAAVADGWSIEPTYATEPVERAARLKREGFIATALMRERGTDDTRGYRYEAKVSAWGPDGMVIAVPSVYDFAQVKSAVRRCNLCGARMFRHTATALLVAPAAHVSQRRGVFTSDPAGIVERRLLMASRGGACFADDDFDDDDDYDPDEELEDDEEDEDGDDPEEDELELEEYIPTRTDERGVMARCARDMRAMLVNDRLTLGERAAVEHVAEWFEEEATRG